MTEPLFPELNGAGGNSAAAPANPPLSPQILGAGATAPLLTDLFGQNPNAVSSSTAQSSVVDAVMAKGEREKILGPKPKMAGELSIEATSFDLGKALFKLAVLLALGTYGFFFTQLSPTFQLLGQNSVQQLASFRDNFKIEQTDINFYNFLVAKFALDDFSVAADTYLYTLAQYESAYTPNNTKVQLKQSLTDLQETMKIALKKAKETLTHPLYPKALISGGNALDIKTLEQEYRALLKTKINTKKREIQSSDASDAEMERSNLESALALIDARDLTIELKGLDLDRDLESGIVQRLFQYSTSLSKNEFTTILNIKSARVNWSDVLLEIETITQDVDPLYGSGIKSNIVYSSLNFNASAQTIGLNGSTQTDDSRNFTLVTNLMEKFEQSALFSDVTQRSFSKSESRDEEFTSGFNIALKLQYGPDDRDETLSLIPQTTESTEVIEDSAETEENPENADEPGSSEPNDSPQPQPQPQAFSFSSFLSANLLSPVEQLWDSLWNSEAQDAFGGRVPR